MLPSILYTVLLASAFTVSAAPVGPIALDGTGNSVGDVLSNNEFKNIDIAKLAADKPAGVDVKPVTGAVPPTPDAEGAVPKDTPSPETVHFVKQSVTDGKVATFKAVDGNPFDFNFLGAMCCSNLAEVLESGNVDDCQIEEDCVMELIAFSEGKQTTVTTLVSDPKTGVMVPKGTNAKDVKVPGAPQLDTTTPASLLGGGQVDQVVVVAKNLGKTVKRQEGVDEFLAYYYATAYDILFGLADPEDFPGLFDIPF